VTSADRTAYPRFGRVVTGRESAEAFTPTDAGMEWARAETQGKIAHFAGEARVTDVADMKKIVQRRSC